MNNQKFDRYIILDTLVCDEPLYIIWKNAIFYFLKQLIQ